MDMTHKSKLQVYLTHDTEDVELVSLLADILNSTGLIDVFVSPFDLPGVVPDLDSKKESEIENCDFMITLFTRRAMRSTLVMREVALAKQRNKIVFPLLDYSGKIRKVGQLIGEYQEMMFDRRNIIPVVHQILQKIRLLQPSFDIPLDLFTEAEKRLEKYSKRPFSKRMFKHLRVASFRRIVADALRKLGYSIKEQSYWGRVFGERPGIIAVRKGKKICVNCVLREATPEDVSITAKQSISESGEGWIICTNFTLKTQRTASNENVNLFTTKDLLSELPTPDKESLWQEFVQLSHVQASFTINRKLYPKLEASLRATYDAKTPIDKGRSLERLTECFVRLLPKLEIAGRNVRIESEELDIVVKNENERIFWQRLGAPIIVECKNWTKPVGAPEIRNLVQKMREVRTAFLIAAHGVTSKDGAHSEIIEARKRMKFILVFDLRDFEEILRGVNPEEIIEDRFYSLWTRSRM